MSRVLVMGAGAFGTALAVSLAQRGAVTLWARDAEHVSEMRARGENTRRLGGVPLPESVTVTAELGDLPKEMPVLLAVPMQTMHRLLRQHAPTLTGRTLVACCKGVDVETGLGPTGIIARALSDSTPAVLTGPGFARDIALGLPTALTLACADAGIGASLQERLTTPNLRLYRSTDTVGAELGGAVKNVIAIGCGAVMGAGLGESARAALMTRGFAEMRRLALHLGARPETLTGLSGLGDLALTCTSQQSRNYRFGQSLGRGERFDPTVTVEGAATARALAARAERDNLDMPLTRVIAALAEGELNLAEAMNMLLSRPLREE